METPFEVGSSHYEKFITDLNAHCEKCIVFLQFYHKSDVERKNRTFFGTGIIFASGNKSCAILALYHNRKDQICEVRFFDGTKRVLEERSIRGSSKHKLTTIYVHKADIPHGTIAFSDGEIASGQMVFTCGFNSNQPEKSFISGDLAGGIGIQDTADVITFTHGCSTGIHGHLGSAVVNKEGKLVGINAIYTRSRGIDYSSEGSENGGLVSALNLNTIQSGLQYMYRKDEKSISQILQEITASMRGAGAGAR